MSLVAAPGSSPTAPPDVERRTIPVWALLLAAFALLSLVRVITGSYELTSAGTIRELIFAAVPITMAGLAGLWSERAGVVNIGLEGMLILGALGAGYFGYHYGPWVGVLGGFAFGVIGGLMHALATVTFGVDHIVSGVAVNIIAAGAAGYLTDTWFSHLEGGGPTQSPPLDNPGVITISGVADWSKTVEDKHWFIVSDLASLIGALTRELSVLTLLAAALVALTAWVLWHTGFGLRLRSCGENPVAAETLGVSVYRYKFLAVLTSGAISGFGGAFLSLAWVGLYQDGISGGRGYIGLAAMIFGNWRIGGLLMGAALFGYTDALQLRAGGETIHSLLLALAIILAAYGIYQLTRGLTRPGVVTLVAAAVMGLWFGLTDTVPEDFTKMTPYVATLLVLAFAAQKLRMPAADGLRYRKGQAG